MMKNIMNKKIFMAIIGILIVMIVGLAVAFTNNNDKKIETSNNTNSYSLEEVNNEDTLIEINYFDSDEEIIITDIEEINKIKDIVSSYTYEGEPCEGIFTHIIKINNETYNVLESCGEINYKGRQSKLNEDDLKYIINITQKYSKLILLTIDCSTLTTKGAKFSICNDSHDKYTYGVNYRIDINENETWKKLPVKSDIAWEEIAFDLNAKTTNEIEINWENLYGELNIGKYRLVKYIFKNSNTPVTDDDAIEVYAEFEIKKEDVYGWNDESTEGLSMISEDEAVEISKKYAKNLVNSDSLRGKYLAKYTKLYEVNLTEKAPNNYWLITDGIIEKNYVFADYTRKVYEVTLVKYDDNVELDRAYFYVDAYTGEVIGGMEKSD